MCDFSDLNEMVKLLEGKLLRYAGGFLKNSAEAQDAVQEAFLRYIRYRREKEKKKGKDKSRKQKRKGRGKNEKAEKKKYPRF